MIDTLISFISFIHDQVFKIIYNLPSLFIVWMLFNYKIKKLEFISLIREEQNFIFERERKKAQKLAIQIKKDIDDNLEKQTILKNDILAAIDKIEFAKVEKLDKIINKINKEDK